MLFKLLKHDWLALRRSPIWTQSAIQTVILGLFGLYIILIFLSLGAISEELIEEFLPNSTATQVVYKFIIYYFLSDLITRFTLQKYPSLAIKNYLIHNIKKSTLSRYLLTRSLFSFFNFAPFFFFIPFFLISISPLLSSHLERFQWFMTLTLLITINHFLSFFIDKYLVKKSYLSFGLLCLIMLGLGLDSQGYISLSALFEPAFNFIFTNVSALIPLLLVLSILINSLYRLFKNTAYLDLKSGSASISRRDFALFDYFGLRLGPLLKLEAKLIWRNRRSRHYLIASLAFLLFPFLFMGDEELQGNWLNIVLSLMITGAFTLNYGQLIYSWNSTHFDLILAQNIKIRDYLESKFVIMALSNVFFFAISFLYYFVYPELMATNVALFFFNTGCTIFVYMFLSVTASKKIDANKGGAFSFEGFGAAHYLVFIPLIAIPILIFSAFAEFGSELIGIMAIGTFGILGIVFRSYLIGKAEEYLLDRKYELSANFKK